MHERIYCWTACGHAGFLVLVAGAQGCSSVRAVVPVPGGKRVERDPHDESKRVMDCVGGVESGMLRVGGQHDKRSIPNKISRSRVYYSDKIMTSTSNILPLERICSPDPASTRRATDGAPRSTQEMLSLAVDKCVIGRSAYHVSQPTANALLYHARRKVLVLERISIEGRIDHLISQTLLYCTGRRSESRSSGL
jgi:hypothetical protein